MYNIADISCEKYHSQGTDDCRTVGCDNRTQQAEDTDRGQLQDHFHTFHKDLIQIIECVYNADVFLTDEDDRETKDDRAITITCSMFASTIGETKLDGKIFTSVSMKEVASAAS